MLKLMIRHKSPTGFPAPLPEALVSQRNSLLTSLLYSMSKLSQLDEPNAVIQGICDAMVAASPHIRLVWAWHGEPDTQMIAPMLFAGPAADYASTLHIKRNYLTLKGPAFRALEAECGEHMDVTRMSLFGPWRRAAKTYGFAVAAAFPLRVPDSRRRGLLIFYADDRDFSEMIGLDPFKALAKLAEASLLQAERRRLLEAQATTDPLTGLHNRRFMDRELERFRQLRVHQGTPFVLLLIDIDYFKSINDTYGHPCGDGVLIKMAEILRQNMRAGDLLARWGGEEFICALANATLAGAFAWAERIRQIFADSTLVFGGVVIRWTVSIGVAASEARTKTICDLMNDVDKALYEAKSGGRNRVMQICAD